MATKRKIEQTNEKVLSFVWRDEVDEAHVPYQTLHRIVYSQYQYHPSDIIQVAATHVQTIISPINKSNAHLRLPGDQWNFAQFNCTAFCPFVLPSMAFIVLVGSPCIVELEYVYAVSRCRIQFVNDRHKSTTPMSVDAIAWGVCRL